MADAVTAESVGSITTVDPNAVGGAGPEGRVLTEAGRVAHPETAPETTGDAPSEASGADGGQPSADDYKAWKDGLPPDQQKHIDRIVNDVRQKDVERLRELEGTVGRLGWAEELNRLVSSENPSDRQRATALLEATLATIKQYTPQAASDPLEGVDWQALDAIAPGASKAFQTLVQQNQTLQQRLGETHTVAESAAHRTAEREFRAEADELQAWAKSNNLPFDLDKIIETENRLNIADLRSAYYATYGNELVESGRKAAHASLTRKKDASLPGGSVGGTAPSRPKFTSMQDQWEWLKRERGITGPLEYKG